MKKRTRAHEAGSIEAGSSKSKSFFLLIVSMGQSVASQGEPGAPRASKASQPERPGHPDRATRGQIEPARASQKRPGPPNRASRGAQGRDAASQDAPGHSADRPAGGAGPLLDSWSSNFVMDVPKCEHCVKNVVQRVQACGKKGVAITNDKKCGRKN